METAVAQDLIAEIVRRILKVANPERIILFGSAAAGKMTRDSDIDLLVVERQPSHPRLESLRIDQALRGLGRPIDVFVAAERYEESKNVIGGLAYPAHKHGRVIYEARERCPARHGPPLACQSGTGLQGGPRASSARQRIP